MWKFILFIIIGSIIIWQLGLFNPQSPKTSLVKEEEKITKSVKEIKENKPSLQKEEAKKEKEGEKIAIKKDALSNILSGKTKNIKIETKKQEPLTNKLQQIVKSETKSSNYQSMLESAAKEDLKPDNAVKVKSKSINPPVAKTGYEEMLAKEAEDSAGDNVVRLSEISKKSSKKQKIEKITKKEESPSQKPVLKNDKTAKILLRENLKKLIMGAGIEIKDKKLASLLKEETKTDNAVKIKPESKEDLIKNIIKEVSKNPKVKNSYVVGLLKEVSKEKMDIVSVTKDYTLVKIKEGDNLWNIAKRIYGNGFKYKLIYEANKDKLSDPNVVTVGSIIKVPKE